MSEDQLLLWLSWESQDSKCGKEGINSNECVINSRSNWSSYLCFLCSCWVWFRCWYGYGLISLGVLWNGIRVFRVGFWGCFWDRWGSCWGIRWGRRFDCFGGRGRIGVLCSFWPVSWWWWWFRFNFSCPLGMMKHKFNRMTAQFCHVKAIFSNKSSYTYKVLYLSCFFLVPGFAALNGNSICMQMYWLFTKDT